MSLKNNSIKVIFFDAGGVLFHEQVNPQDKLRKILNSRGISKNLIESALEKSSLAVNTYFRQGVEPKNWDEEKKLWKLVYKIIAAEADKTNPYFADELLMLTQFTNYYKLYPEVNHILEDLVDNYTLGVISNALPSVDLVFDFLEIRKYFKLITISSFVQMRKPGEDIYKYSIKQIGSNPSECLFIDDKLENIKSAKKIGMQTIHLKRPENDLYIIDDLIPIRKLNKSLVANE